MISCRKSRLPLIGVAFLLFCSITVKAQSKTDTLIAKKDIATLRRNMIIIQNNLHTAHIDAVLRDKLDSVYMDNIAILAEKKNGKKP